MTKVIEILTDLGGKEWTSPDGDLHRVYFDFELINKLAGLEVFWKKGNIDTVYKNGTKISKTAAYKIVADNTAKLFYDAGSNRFGFKNVVRETAEAAIAAINSAIASA